MHETEWFFILVLYFIAICRFQYIQKNNSWNFWFAFIWFSMGGYFLWNCMIFDVFASSSAFILALSLSLRSLLFFLSFAFPFSPLLQTLAHSMNVINYTHVIIFLKLKSIKRSDIASLQWGNSAFFRYNFIGPYPQYYAHSFIFSMSRSYCNEQHISTITFATFPITHQ